jgi:4-hydroxybenzoate polyprenyltransferase
MVRKINNYIKEMRPAHWIKNLLVLLPPFFGGRIASFQILIFLLGGVISFSFIASGIYIINDIHDKPQDALHPIKRKRPIASGIINIKEAIVISILLLCIGFAGCILTAKSQWPVVVIIVIIYILANFFYSLFCAKNIPVLDIILVSLGYVLRIIFGGAISNTYISMWLFVTILSISLFMAIEKRRKEMENDTKYRNVLTKYTSRYLSVSGTVMMSVAIIFFILWAMELGKKRDNVLFPYIASVDGIIGLLLYRYDTEVSDTGDPVEIITHDKVLVVLGIVFLISFLIDV